ncbi:MAG: HD domain-containing protein [Bacteroidia bacterium]|nr:HD domain-containing protein [Bacteroidia bacterium]
MENSLKLSKIINDPVHGFIEIPRGTILSLIDTAAFQRLRRIKQLGMSALVYPGAQHTRFNHALGAMHLMRMALDVLKRKKVKIDKQEYRAALIAILMHDIGHGPFSHALEHVIIPGMHHEEMSLALMHYLNKKMKGKLSLAIEIFEGKYERHFLHQLVSSQLDMDRLDYLTRDSFFTGVVEGVIGTDRIIKVLNVLDNQLVVEDKGIYSIEKFIVARRLMYWQVYLHKAALSAEVTMVNILKRARDLYQEGSDLGLGENLNFFFKHQITSSDLNEEVLERFIQLDDSDIEYAIKQWQHHSDPILSDLCTRILTRRLLKIHIQDEEVSKADLEAKQQAFLEQNKLPEEALKYYVFTGTVANQAYLENNREPILIWFKKSGLKDLASASDIQNIHTLSTPVVKYYLCYPEMKA